MVFLLNNVMKKNTFTKLTEDDFVTVYCKDGEILDGVVNVVPHAVDIGINQYGDLDMQITLPIEKRDKFYIFCVKKYKTIFLLEYVRLYQRVKK